MTLAVRPPAAQRRLGLTMGETPLPALSADRVETRAFAFGLAGACGLLLASPASAEVVLDWPVDCTVGVTCEVQHYVDHGGGGDAKDYRCGTITYKGHNGVDIRVLTMADEQRGVDVRAAAPGHVLRVRDGMADVSIRDAGRDAVRDKECGNGLVIAHDDGFETQYCHMAQGSLVVKAGDAVVAGQKLGHIGLSGDTEFPHLHITVRHNGTVIDPYAYGEPDGACSGGVSLWRPALQPALEYKAGTVLNAGFASRSVTMEDIEAGTAGEPLNAASPAVLAYVRAIGLRTGDVQRIVLTGPRGALLDHSVPPLASNKDQLFVGVGRKRPPAGWPPGRYAATYSVTRDGKVVIEKAFSATLSP